MTRDTKPNNIIKGRRVLKVSNFLRPNNKSRLEHSTGTACTCVCLQFLSWESERQSNKSLFSCGASSWIKGRRTCPSSRRPTLDLGAKSCCCIFFYFHANGSTAARNEKTTERRETKGKFNRRVTMDFCSLFPIRLSSRHGNAGKSNSLKKLCAYKKMLLFFF